MIALLQAGYYAEPHAARYDAATMGMFVLIIAIGVIGFIVQARLQSVFKKYSKVQFPGGLTGAEVAEKMLRDNNIHNVKVCLLYTSPSPRDCALSRMPSSA